MTPIQNVKQELLREIEKLPEHKLPEVLQFVSFLLFSQNHNFQRNQNHLEHQKKNDTSDANPDPLADFIGAVSHGALAQNTDRELYES